MPLVQFSGSLTKNEFRDIIRHERRIELALEGQRYFDLKRWGMIKEVMDKTKDQMELHGYLWPEIPYGQCLNLR
jgi:hypothetical protein